VGICSNRSFGEASMSTMTKQFWNDGYIVLRGIFEPAYMNEFRDELQGTIRAYVEKAARVSGRDFRVADEDLFDAGIAYLEEVDHAWVAALYDTIAQLPSFFRIMGHARIQATANELLGRAPKAPLYGFTQSCRIDPPRDARRTYGWHQEIFYTIPNARFLQTWAPLVRPTSVDTGTIELKEGSHRLGIPPQTWIDEEGRAPQILVDEAQLEEFATRRLEMDVGDLLIFTGQTVHRSGSNTSPKVRYSLVGMYHDIDYPGFVAPKPGVEMRGMSQRAFFDSATVAGAASSPYPEISLSASESRSKSM
jgi:hypothetical protein